MKGKAKTKNPNNDSNEADGCHGNSRPGPSTSGEGVRRSTRKRTAPKTFVMPPKKTAGYWSTTEKESLLKVLEELNSGQLGKSAIYSSNRYPYRLIRKRVRTKSHDEIKRYLTILEHRGAAMTLSEMKHQPPLESWRQMADKLTVLTSDNCSRHLIRVCNVMALESREVKEDKEGKEDREGRDDNGEEVEERNAPRTPATTMTLPPANPTPPPTPAPSASTRGTAASVGSSAGEMASSTPAATQLTARPAASRSSSSTTAAAAAFEARNGGASAAVKPTNTEKAAACDDLQLTPDYAAIYKYIGTLMQGERKQLGPLESLVVLDCLNLVEEHLKGRDNKQQKEFAQERFMDILEKLYLTTDYEGTQKNVKDGAAALQQEAGNGDQELVTVADLIGTNKNQQQCSSQAGQLGGACPANNESENGTTAETATDTVHCLREGATPDQSEVVLLSEVQSVSTPAPSSQSNERLSSMSQGHPVPTLAPRRNRVVPVGLGSLNPFSIPTRLLDIRRGKRD